MCYWSLLIMCILPFMNTAMQSACPKAGEIVGTTRQFGDLGKIHFHLVFDWKFVSSRFKNIQTLCSYMYSCTATKARGKRDTVF